MWPRRGRYWNDCNARYDCARHAAPFPFAVLHLPNGICVEIAIAQSCDSAANQQGLAKLVWTTPRKAEDAVSNTFLLPVGGDPCELPIWITVIHDQPLSYCCAVLKAPERRLGDNSGKSHICREIPFPHPARLLHDAIDPLQPDPLHPNGSALGDLGDDINTASHPHDE